MRPSHGKPSIPSRCFMRRPPLPKRSPARGQSGSTSRRTAGSPRVGRRWREPASRPWRGHSGRHSRRLVGEFSKDGWPNSAAMWRGGLRDLEVLTKMHAKLREFGAGHNHNRRSRVATAVECLIGAMIITPKQLAAELAITEQAQPAYYARCSSAALSGKSQGAKAFVPLDLRDAVICSAACRAATATGRTRRIPRRRSRRA